MSKISSAKCKILGVIDQPKELVLIRYALQKCSYQFWEANTVDSALQLARDNQPDLVLLDVNTPSVEKDSLSLLIKYLQQQQIPLILITSEPLCQEIKKYLAHPTIDYIQRPIDPLGLVLRIKSTLRHKGIQTELGLIRQRLEESNRKLQQGTILDDSTGVFNYSHLLNLVKLEFARGVRHNTPLAFLLIEIPHLKQINKDYGSEARDHLLRELARLIKSSLRLIDIIGRCREDRLGLLLPNTDLASAKLVANRTWHLVKNHTFSAPAPVETPRVEEGSASDGPPLKLDICLGLSAYPDKRVANYEELIEAAKKSLSLAEGEDNSPLCWCSDCPNGQVIGIKS